MSGGANTNRIELSKSRATVEAGGRLHEADLYAFGLRIGTQLLAAGRIKRGMRYLVQPIPYWRSLEYRLVWGAAGFSADDRVLDIGSPKLLSLYLAERVGGEIFATDIEDYFLDEFQFLRQARRIAPETLHLAVEDGRKLSFEDNSFTKIYSISVIEHIPDNGDSECLGEIGRVLRPGGRCLITVPFSLTYQEEYRRPNFYWAGSAGAPADGRVFYCRRYTDAELQNRLVKPSGLTVRQISYVGERFLLHSRRELADYLIPQFTGPIHPIASRLAHTGPTESSKELKKPLAAFLLLTKP
jgi:SAM-dependent methyltransferase